MLKANYLTTACYLIAAFINKKDGNVSEILINNDDTQSLFNISNKIKQPLEVAINSMFGAKQSELVSYHAVYTDRGMDLDELMHYQESIKDAIACSTQTCD